MGAQLTYYVAPDFSGNLVLTISDDQGRQVRRIDVPETPGINRATWNLRGDAPAGARVARAVALAVRARGAARGGAGAAVAARRAAAQRARLRRKWRRRSRRRRAAAVAAAAAAAAVPPSTRAASRRNSAS